MSKELEHLVGFEGLVLGALWLQRGNRLKPEGEKHYWNLIRIILKGQKTSLSEHIRILDGYDYVSNIKGLEHLQRLKGGKALVLGNHSHLGPLEGYGETLLTSYYVKEFTGKEIKWVRGPGKSLKENARQLVDTSLGTIPVYDNSPRSLMSIFKAFGANENVGLYPEGDNSIALRQAKLTAGNLVLKALERDIPVICASTYFQDDTFFATFAPLLDERKTKLRNKEKNITKEKIINYAMAIIAQHLPKEKRGYYQDYQRFIDTFPLAL